MAVLPRALREARESLRAFLRDLGIGFGLWFGRPGMGLCCRQPHRPCGSVDPVPAPPRFAGSLVVDSPVHRRGNQRRSRLLRVPANAIHSLDKQPQHGNSGFGNRVRRGSLVSGARAGVRHRGVGGLVRAGREMAAKCAAGYVRPRLTGRHRTGVGQTDAALRTGGATPPDRS